MYSREAPRREANHRFKGFSVRIDNTADEHQERKQTTKIRKLKTPSLNHVLSNFHAQAKKKAVPSLTRPLIAVVWKLDLFSTQLALKKGRVGFVRQGVRVSANERGREGGTTKLDFEDTRFTYWRGKVFSYFRGANLLDVG